MRYLENYLTLKNLNNAKPCLVPHIFSQNYFRILQAKLKHKKLSYNEQYYYNHFIKKKLKAMFELFEIAEEINEKEFIKKNRLKKAISLIKKWVDFFLQESCGQCTPCREGVYRLKEILNNKNPDWKLFSELLDNLHDTSFCGLGCVVPIPIESFVQNVLKKAKDNKIKLKKKEQKIICDCLS